MLGLRLRTDAAVLLRTLIPLHINIATVMSIVLVLVAGAILVNDQIVGRRAALAEARASFQSLGETVRIELQSLHGPVETAVEATSMAMSLLAPEERFTVETVQLFARRIVETDKLFALYYGDRKGNFVLVFNLAEAAPGSEAAYMAWIIRRPDADSFKQTVVMMNDEFGVISTDDRQNNGYDPRDRPWFHAAMTTDGPIRTPPYLYFQANGIGITIAKRTLDNQGVVGGDLTLATFPRPSRRADPPPALMRLCSTIPPVCSAPLTWRMCCRSEGPTSGRWSRGIHSPRWVFRPTTLSAACMPPATARLSSRWRPKGRSGWCGFRRCLLEMDTRPL